MDMIQNLLLNPVRFYECIEACFECANASWICADASLSDRDRHELGPCIDLCLSTAEVCAATARMLAREERVPFELTVHQLRHCMETCKLTSIECARFVERFEHSFIAAKCAEECLRACSECLDLLKINQK